MRNLPLAFILIIFNSCTKERVSNEVAVPSGCVAGKFYFDTDILPIFNANCNFAECHSSGATGSYDFHIYNVVRDRIQAGTLEYRLDLPIDDPQHMPEDLRLSPCDYFIIKSWIRQGYPKNN
jgi:hypothetical protein